MECRECRFFKEFIEEMDEDEMCLRGEGECRKNPPTIVFETGMTGNMVGAFPGVFKDFWCGSFEKKVSEVPDARPYSDPHSR